MYPAVPETRPVRVRCWSEVAMAIPKSMRTGPRGEQMMLEGLMSRWMMSAWWTAAIVDATW